MKGNRRKLWNSANVPFLDLGADDIVVFSSGKFTGL